MNFDSPRTAGIVLVAGFVMMVIGAFVAPQGAYEGEIPDRLSVIASQEGGWIASKVFDALSVVGLSAGMVLLAVANTNLGERGWLNTVGGLCFAVAGVVGLVWVYFLVVEPGPLYDRDTPAPIAVAFVALVAVGLLAYGIHFLKVGYPNWLAVINISVGGLVFTALMFIAIGGGPPEAAFPIVAFINLAALVTGITLIFTRAPTAYLPHHKERP